MCIHPFADGNGRVARLATTHLLDRAGYRVSRYVSIEQLFFDTRDGYYAALADSTDGWFGDLEHTLWPWACYFVDQVADAYARFEVRVTAGAGAGTKQNRITNYVLLHAAQTFTISDIRRAVPGVSDNTIRLVLAKLRDQGRIASDGTGRSATWRRSRS